MGAVTLEVRDTGPGMSGEEIASALAPPSRPEGHAVNRKSRHGGGLGLGLPLVCALAEANGASFVIESTPGSGTTARIRFPATMHSAGRSATREKS
jgi:signal transduction histidine kinase